MLVSSLILKQLYTYNSLRNSDRGLLFSIKNRLSDAQIAGIKFVKINGESLDLSQLSLESEESVIKIDQISSKSPLVFSLAKTIDFVCPGVQLSAGKHKVEILFDAPPFGELLLVVEDGISDDKGRGISIPRNKEDDYCDAAVQSRKKFIKEVTGVTLEHSAHFSIQPKSVEGNCEHFIGVAQIPLGIAGPIQVHGEHAQGDFIIPMATTEGTLVASYNRGIKVANLSGGIKCTVQRDAMQRAPVFVFEDARAARNFVDWVKIHFNQIATEAEQTSSVARLQYIDPYLSNKFAFLRFNFYTGDAAGQNMVGRATFAACSWIIDHYHDHKIKHFYLESNFATDKKASQVNIMRTRGKRVTAEVVLKRDVLLQHMRVAPEQLAYHYGVANIGAIMSGANNHGLHSANAITAMFIATGQDVANVAESSAGLVYCELTAEKDLYFSITIPSLIVATYGGGTGLGTQKESLEILGCYGKDKVMKLAEIICAVVLAGEISLAAAISSSDWVSSHEQYGRNR
jgi:hydroxymethylglutaryl-CoA reductase (NADPH)